MSLVNSEFYIKPNDNVFTIYEQRPLFEYPIPVADCNTEKQAKAALDQIIQMYAISTTLDMHCDSYDVGFSNIDG